VSAFENDGSRVFLLYRELPDDLRPCAVVRNTQASLLMVDPRSTSVEATAWVVQWLTIAEQNTLRAAHGYGPVGAEGCREWVSDDLVPSVVPAPVRLPARVEARLRRGPTTLPRAREELAG
jgi:hypothetical protein